MKPILRRLNKHGLAVRVFCSADGGEYYHVGAELAQLAAYNPAHADRAREWPVVCPKEIDGLYIGGITLWSQGDRTSADLYGVEIALRDRYSMDLRELESACAVMRAVTDSMSALSMKYGEAPTHEERILRFAQAVGASSVCVYDPRGLVAGSGGGYMELPMTEPSSARAALRMFVRGATRVYGPREPAGASA